MHEQLHSYFARKSVYIIGNVAEIYKDWGKEICFEGERIKKKTTIPAFSTSYRTKEKPTRKSL